MFAERQTEREKDKKKDRQRQRMKINDVVVRNLTRIKILP